MPVTYKYDSKNVIRWYYSICLFGERKHGACKGCTTESEAKEYEAQEKMKLSLKHRGLLDESNTISISQMLDEFMDYSKANNRESSYKSNLCKLDTIREYFGGNTTIDTITPNDLEKFKSYLITTKKLSNASYNRYHSLLQKAFNLIIINKRLKLQNPYTFVNKLDEDNHIQNNLSIEDEKRLLDELAPHLRPIIICALRTGLRIGNCLNLRWEYINFKDKIITIPLSEMKSKKEHTIPLGTRLEKELKNIGVKKEGFVFVNPKTNKPYSNIHKGFKEALRRAGMDSKFRIHDLRHAVGTRICQNMDIITAREILGHSSVQVTQRYTHTNMNDKRRAVDMLDCLE